MILSTISTLTWAIKVRERERERERAVSQRCSIRPKRTFGRASSVCITRILTDLIAYTIWPWRIVSCFKTLPDFGCIKVQKEGGKGSKAKGR